MNRAERSELRIVHGTSVEVPARDVVVGDEIACRNSCGGLKSWDRVTEGLRHGVITAAGCYVVDSADELVEVKA